MRHPVLFTMYNTTSKQLELTKLALESVLAQDVGLMEIHLVDNGSNEETLEWTDELPIVGNNFDIIRYRFSPNQSPVKVFNQIAENLFKKFPHLLSVPNDVLLPKSCYRLLASFPRGFVSATPIEDREQYQPEADTARAISTNTPMCCMLIRRWAYQAIVDHSGHFFDESLFHYGSDCDLALRMSACGIRGVQLDVPVWHYRSGSHRLAENGEGEKIRRQADIDRETFEQMWGFKVSDPQYAEAALDINFRGEKSKIGLQSTK